MTTKDLSIITIDLGTQMGWASYSPETNIISGTESFRPGRFEGGGMRGLRFKNWLTEMKNSLSRIDAVFFEEVRARQPSVASDHVYGGLLMILTTWCEHHEVPYQGVPVGTIKRFITGKGNANKQKVIKAVEDLGHKPKDDNEADAIALMHYVLSDEGPMV